MGQSLRKVLVIEDCASDVFLLEHMLHDAGNQTIEIHNAPRLIDAFQRIDEETFDVILLDLNLPDIDGIASIAALSVQAPMTPIIIYSGQEDPKIRNKALLCGAKDYLVKGRETGLSLEYAIVTAHANRLH